MENQKREIVEDKEGGVESAAATFPVLNLSPTLQHSTTGISSSVLNLSPTLHHSTNGISSMTTTADGGLLEKCTNYGVSTKRERPSSSEQPSPKRATLHSASASPNHNLSGFTKLQLTHPLPSPLQSSVSRVSALNPELEEGSKPSALQETSPSLVEAPPSTSESPNTRRHKKLKERIEGINQLSNQLQRVVKEIIDEASVIKGEYLTEVEEPTEEAVWAEKKGEFLILHFRCPCKKCYEILLGENSCYYKLTSL